MRFVLLLMLMLYPVSPAIAKETRSYSDVSMVTGDLMRQFMRDFIEALNAGDEDTVQAMQPYLDEKANITFKMFDSRQGQKTIRLRPDDPKGARQFRSVLSGFVEIHGIRTASDLRSGAGKIRFYRTSDTVFESDLKRTDSGLIFGKSLKCGFQFILTQDKDMKLTRLTCE